MYWHFFFAEEDDRVPTPDADGSESAGLDSFEGVLHLVESSLGGEDGDEVLVALVGFTHAI